VKCATPRKKSFDRNLSRSQLNAGRYALARLVSTTPNRFQASGLILRGDGEREEQPKLDE
jgi:hypothetical protein